ncbi:MFS general substrate transporter [Laetiporus sulphureus 93-53]|uniref:MFS general substrate transporter n=1 Tax=Laetiporus sulphureus 93-53 TaxID=1314785 RepID=A0A165BZF2_9APHY|nr:MFS general substrate transporter [Laetiporus sulphureus 93-53]KZT01929.1 MFS general substrate transporter [Laetiporus sulphureus 93-53]
MSSSRDNDETRPTVDHERTPLLPDLDLDRRAKANPAITPLPKLQIGVLLLLQLGEPITSQCIYPFINQLVSELDITGGDERKVGYYAGLIESLFFLTEAMFILQWSRVSDYIGRKPVLLIGTAGLCTSMICFGLSRTFWQLVVSRCLVGALNGNIGVMKSMMGELTDHTNMAQGFSFMPIVWSFGATLGPLIGGQLAKPHDRWPRIFTSRFWIDYPYFLPCATSAAFCAVVFAIVAVFLKETVQKKRFKIPSGTTETDESLHALEEVFEAPAPLRSLLIWPVLLSVANYGALAFLEIAYRATQPLFYSTPIELGGLGFSPATIGALLGTWGVMNGSVQALFFAPVVRRWGPKRVFMAGMSTFVPLFSLFPLINALAFRTGMTPAVWGVVFLQLTVSIVMDMSFGCILMFVTTCAPNRRSLGATNGVAQVAGSVVRAVGPAFATSTYALSLEQNWLGGYGVYLILIVIACALFTVTFPLPYETWTMDNKISAQNIAS